MNATTTSRRISITTRPTQVAAQAAADSLQVALAKKGIVVSDYAVKAEPMGSRWAVVVLADDSDPIVLATCLDAMLG